MLQNLNLFWRYFLTGFICILLSSIFTFFTVQYVDKSDNQNTFKEETKQLLEELNLAVKTQPLQQLLEDPKFTFEIETSLPNDNQIKLNKIKELGDNRYEISYFSKSLQKVVTLRDKSHESNLINDVHDDSHNNDDHLIDLLERIAWVLAIVSLLATGFYFVNRQTDKHIQKLVTATEKISLGEFDTDIPIDSPEPIRQIAKQLEKTRNNIKHLLQKEKTLAYAIPHELRTPLSKIRLALDLSRKHTCIKDYENLVEDLDRYTDELEQLVNQLMSLAITETKTNNEKINLNEKLQTLKTEYEILHPNKEITLESSVDTIFSSKTQLSLILNNLMQNAANYSDQYIKISTSETDEHFEIAFSNDGETISKEQRDKIFDPFYRTDQSRNRKTGGAGIGLALVKEAVNTLQGNIEIGDSTDSTFVTVFSVFLPKNIK